MGVCTHIMDHFWIDVGQQNLKHLASSLGTGSSHGHLRTWGRCAGIHPLWNSKAGFCAWKRVEDEKSLEELLILSFLTPSLWFSNFPSFQNFKISRNPKLIKSQLPAKCQASGAFGVREVSPIQISSAAGRTQQLGESRVVGWWLEWG